MSNYFRKNQRKLLAIFGVLLMITFVVSLGQNSGPSGGGGNPVVGTWNGGEIHRDEYNRAQREWEQLSEKMRVPNPQFRYAPIASLVLGDSARRIDAITFLLLVKEAQKMNVVVPAKDVGEVAKMLPPTGDPDLQDFQFQALSDLLAVQRSLTQVMNVIKVSEPAAIQRAAADTAMLSVNLINFSADQFKSEPASTLPATSRTASTTSATTAPAIAMGPINLVASRATTFPTLVEAGVTAPTPEEAALYNKFKDVEGDRVDYTADPFGFAYKFPNRIKFDSIFVSSYDVENQVVVPELAVLRYFRDHPTEFPATQPTTVPAATQAAATSPSTRAVATTAPTTQSSRPTVIADVHKDIEKKLREEFTKKVLDEIRKDIANQLTTDYQAFAEGQKSGKSSVSSLGSPYNSYEYMEELAKHIENLYGSGGKYAKLYHDNFFSGPNDIKEQYTGKMFDVFPTPNSRSDQWFTQKDLEAIKPTRPDGPGIGMSAVMNSYIPFPAYAMIAADPFLNDDQRKTLKDQHIQPLSLWQPSQPLFDSKHVYYFRLTNADPAHTPPLAEILPRVREDARTLAGYERAEAQANKFVAAAREIGLQQAANQWNLPKSAVVSVGPFHKESDTRDTLSSFGFMNFDLPQPARQKFADEAFKLLDDYARNPGSRAVRLIPLPSVGQAVVAELDTSKLTLLTNGENYAKELEKAQRTIFIERMRPIMDHWLTPAAVDQRTGFKGTDIKHDDRPQNNNNGPLFPF